MMRLRPHDAPMTESDAADEKDVVLADVLLPSSPRALVRPQDRS